MSHTGQQTGFEASSATNGQSLVHDLFALTDEQILEIEPETEVASSGWRVASEESSAASSNALAVTDAQTPNPVGAKLEPSTASFTSGESQAAGRESRVTSHDSVQPPRWLADMIADPQAGKEARDFWNGIQQARQEAAAYRELFPKPEDARSAAQRARLLDDIDRAYFAGDPSQRAQLAASMMRDDPAAFREMVFAGLRALQEAGKQGDEQAHAADAVNQYSQSSQDSSTSQGAEQSSRATEAQFAAYAAFERSANEDLERSVGGAIARTLEQALPNSSGADNSGMRERLAATIRQEIERALQGDRQLGGQVAEILSGRRGGEAGVANPRLDHATRAQVVRLIGERAQQLVPVTAKRVLSEWTQTTLASHRARTSRADAALSRQEVATASSPGNHASRPSSRQGDATNTGRTGRKPDYGRLSDEQILDM
jgi:hypothetical protein